MYDIKCHPDTTSTNQTTILTHATNKKYMEMHGNITIADKTILTRSTPISAANTRGESNLKKLSRADTPEQLSTTRIQRSCGRPLYLRINETERGASMGASSGGK